MHRRGTMAASFVTADYLTRTQQREVLEDDGTWTLATVYTHRASRSVVLWFGGTKYEGIGAGYHWGSHADPTAAGSAHTQQLLDGDGCVIETRPHAATRRPACDLVKRGSTTQGGGDGLYTTRAFKKGEVVAHLTGCVV